MPIRGLYGTIHLVLPILLHWTGKTASVLVWALMATPMSASSQAQGIVETWNEVEILITI